MIRADSITHRPAPPVAPCAGCNRDLSGTADHACYPNGAAVTLWPPRPTRAGRPALAAVALYADDGQPLALLTLDPDQARRAFDSASAAMLDAQT